MWVRNLSHNITYNLFLQYNFIFIKPTNLTDFVIIITFIKLLNIILLLKTLAQTITKHLLEII